MDVESLLTRGGLYTREELSNLMGGDRQHGIVNAKKTDSVLVIMGSENHPDRIEGDIIYYHGAGMKGDQKMDRLNNNLVLAETLENGKRVFLFKIRDDNRVEYISEVVLESEPTYEYVPEESRRKYIFRLRLVDSSPTSDGSELEKRIESLSHLSKVELFKRMPERGPVPKRHPVTVERPVRDPKVVAYTLKRAGGVCELCGCNGPFMDANGTYFLEVHHIEFLSEGGEDAISNTAALCPNCHRKMHHIKDLEDIRRLKSHAMEDYEEMRSRET